SLIGRFQRRCRHGATRLSGHRPLAYGTMRSCSSAPHRKRRGIALLTTLAILSLAAALLAGGFVSATATTRATRSTRAGIVAEQTARRALGESIIAWSRVEDTLPIGGAILRT